MSDVDNPATASVVDPTSDLPFALGGPPLTGTLRAAPEHFRVEEIAATTPSGDGEHVLLQVEKRNRNTADVARLLARHADVPLRHVSFAGQKDRNAVTSQWFSIQLTRKPMPDWESLEDSDVQVLFAARHNRKLRRGALEGNRFEILVTDLEGDIDEARERIEAMRRQGVPAYYGAQRFGRGGSNLAQARELFESGRTRMGRERLSMLLSTVRSFLANEVLARRVRMGTWREFLPGDVVALEGSRSQFPYQPEDASLEDRLRALDVHPTVPLPGGPSRALVPTGEVAAMEAAVLKQHDALMRGLLRFNVDADRRAARQVVHELTADFHDEALLLRFRLNPGYFATSVLRELVR